MLTGTLPTNIVLPFSNSDLSNMDDKGRIILTKPKRDVLGEQFAMGVGTRGFIVCYSQAQLLHQWAIISQYPPQSAAREDYTRIFFEDLHQDIKPDGQGRVVIPEKLREHAQIKKQVRIIGAGERIEIWAEEEYKKYQADRKGYGMERAQLLRDAWDQMVAEGRVMA